MGERYALGPALGAGGMGVVYEAEDRALSRPVAVKLLSPRYEMDANAVARLEREALAAARLAHPNIVRVLDLVRDGAGLFLVMEQLAGEALDARIDRDGPLSVKAAVAVHLQLLDALAAAHEAGILHRDVKPGNVFLTPLADGALLVKLLDFGLAYLVEEASQKKLTATGMALGTPAYMAPERIEGQVADERADLYSVGVCLYECLCGELPFRAESAVALYARLMTEEPRPIRAHRSEVSAALSSVVARALARDPSERFQTARAMADALRRASSAERGDEGEALATRETLPATSASVPRPADTRELAGGAPPIAALAPPAARTTRRPPRARSWTVGLALGALAGALALAAIGGLALFGPRQTAPAAPASASAPSEAAARGGAPQAPRVEAPRVEPPTDAVGSEAPVEPVTAEPAVAAPVADEPAEPAAPAARRTPRRRPRPPAAEAQPAPAELHRPLEPQWRTP